MRTEQGVRPQEDRVRQRQSDRQKSLAERLDEEWETLRAKLDEIAATCRSATENIDEIMELLKQALSEYKGRDQEINLSL